MKLLMCLLCDYEVDIIGNEFGVNKKVKCLNPKCGFSNDIEKRQPEIIIMRKRS